MSEADEIAEETALYRIFGDADLLLYIGISNDFGRRWREHARVQPWWPERRQMTVAWYDSRTEAEEAEVAAIGAEHPKYNIEHAIPLDAEVIPLAARRKTVSRRLVPLSVEELVALPEIVDLLTAGHAFGIGQVLCSAMAKDGTFPVEVLTFGRFLRVRKADLMRYLHLNMDGTPAAAPERDVA